MSSFAKLDDEEKSKLHRDIMELVESVGGKNFFFTILEAIKENKNVLTSSNCEFKYPRGYVIWNKSMFKDKFDLLLSLIYIDGNILPKKDDKKYKKVLNMVKALKPIEFTFKPRNKIDGEGFKIDIFQETSDESVTINLKFKALFFYPIDFTKQAMNYQPK